MVESSPSWMVHYSDGKHLNTWRVIQMPFKYWNGIWTVLNKRLVRPFENQTNKRVVIGHCHKLGIRSSDVTFNPASGNRVVTVSYKTEGLSWLLSLKIITVLENKKNTGKHIWYSDQWSFASWDIYRTHIKLLCE